MEEELGNISIPALIGIVACIDPNALTVNANTFDSSTGGHNHASCHTPVCCLHFCGKTETISSLGTSRPHAGTASNSSEEDLPLDNHLQTEQDEGKKRMKQAIQREKAARQKRRLQQQMRNGKQKADVDAKVDTDANANAYVDTHHVRPVPQRYRYLYRIDARYHHYATTNPLLYTSHCRDYSYGVCI